MWPYQKGFFIHLDFEILPYLCCKTVSFDAEDPPALQVSPDCVFVLPWHGLQCWAGSRSKQWFSWGETPQAAALHQMWQLICHLDCPPLQSFLIRLFCAVLSSGPQRAIETWGEGDLIWEKLLFKLLRVCCESVKHYKTWSYHKTQLRGFPVWRSKAQGTDTSHCACPASPGASHSPGSLCQPSPWLSVPVPALLAPREQPALIAPWRKPFKRLDVSALIFHFMPCIYN